MKNISILLIAINVLVLSCIVYGETPSFKVDSNPTLNMVKQYNSSTLYTLSSSGYQDPIFVANLTGTHYEIGYAMGYFLAEEALENFESLLKVAIPYGFERDALKLFLDWQWKDYLSKQITQNYLDEIQGFYDGAKGAGFDKLENAITQAVVISSLPGDPNQNIEALIKNEFLKGDASEFKQYLVANGYDEVIATILNTELFKSTTADGSKPIKGMQCSHFSVWGSRTNSGDMYNGRNLDWLQNSGIAKNKLITFYHPKGSYSHAAIGFAGLIGAITGISSQGIFVAESDNDSNKVTFDGFAWSMRLRYIMEHANSIDAALGLWKATNNTMGMNHMVASSNEATTAPHPAYALETMAGYTAYFPDNSPAEQYLYTNTTTGAATQMGYPIPEAVFRTNHGYDTVIRANQWIDPKPTDDSMIRYMLFHDAFNYYETAQIEISELEAINITSILGAKNNEANFYDCSQGWNGYNIISATYHFAANKMFVAYEEGAGQNRVCACCGTYVQVDLTPFFVSNQIN
ncbi:hypothetical protein CYY_009257 [Polysphondylium violaceum]|uniref:Uncharacterized protein n=1 Tax=Polysphondylium violaceum TaxID=133409 RepID=A0A8J4V0M4_9MYCE|nr:hypothetical protein CYY_009257 [Polysphondylium violaceum]